MRGLFAVWLLLPSFVASQQQDAVLAQLMASPSGQLTLAPGTLLFDAPLNLTAALRHFGRVALAGDPALGTTLLAAGPSPTQLLVGWGGGGGGAQLQLANLSFVGGAGCRGGAVQLEALDSVLLDGCHFANNRAGTTFNCSGASGGGGGGGGSSSGLGSSPAGGGAVHLLDVPRVSSRGCRWRGNTVQGEQTWSRLLRGGAVLVHFWRTEAAFDVAFEGGSFEDNLLSGTQAAETAALWGGALTVMTAPGVHAVGARFALTNVSVLRNAVRSGTSGANGGGVAVHMQGNTTGLMQRIAGSRFAGNVADGYSANGGALVSTVGGPLYDQPLLTSSAVSLQLLDVDFEGNSATAWGTGTSREGGFTSAVASGGAALQTFFGNHAGSNMTASRCRFFNNSVAGCRVFGAGFYHYFNAAPKPIPPGAAGYVPNFLAPAQPHINGTACAFSRCTFEANRLVTACRAPPGAASQPGAMAGGGGAYGIVKLSAPAPEGFGRGVAVYPAWDAAEKVAVTFDGCLLRANNASCISCAGGALLVHGAALTLRRTNVTGNTARTKGGGIMLGSLADSLDADDCLLEGNVALQLYGSQLHSDALGAIALRACRVRLNDPVAFQDVLVEYGGGGQTTHGIMCQNAGNVSLDPATVIECSPGSQLYSPLIEHEQFRSYPWSFLMRANAFVASCVACPAGTYSFASGTRRGQEPPAAIHCLPCPFGAACPGGARVESLPGFWGQREGADAIAFSRCPSGFCCDGSGGGDGGGDGGSDGGQCSGYAQCAGNRTGILCGGCREGFTGALGTAACIPRESCDPAVFWAVALALSFLALAALLWHSSHAPGRQYTGFSR